MKPGYCVRIDEVRQRVKKHGYLLISDGLGVDSAQLDKAATDGVEVHIIEGCHDNLFFEPQVIQLGQQLRICLDRGISLEQKTQL